MKEGGSFASQETYAFTIPFTVTPTPNPPPAGPTSLSTQPTTSPITASPTSVPTLKPTSSPSTIPTPSPTSCVASFKINLLTDTNGSESSWNLETQDGNAVANGSGYNNNAEYEIGYAGDRICLNNGQYKFIVNKSYGEGRCCKFGSGYYYYSIFIDEYLLKEAGHTPATDTFTFSIPLDTGTTN